MDFLECCHGEQVDEEPICSVSGRVFESSALTADHLISTPLFDAILQGDWNGVNFLLQPPGSFTFPPFLMDEDEESASSAKDQAATWVVCRDEQGTYLWRQLPIHSAICYGAPIETVKELVRVYPDGLCSADTNGDLPLHLAIKFNSPEAVVLKLLKAFPEALQAENGDDQLPLQCATTSKDESARSRYQLLQTFVDCKHSQMLKESERQQTELKTVETSMIEAAKELAQATDELEALRQSQTRRFGFGGRSWRKRSDKIRPE